MVQQGQTMEVFEKFYGEDCVMSDNASDKRSGKDTNRDYEKQFINAVEAWNKAEVLSTVVDEEKQTAVTEWFFYFNLKDGPPGRAHPGRSAMLGRRPDQGGKILLRRKLKSFAGS